MRCKAVTDVRRRVLLTWLKLFICQQPTLQSTSSPGRFFGFGGGAPPPKPWKSTLGTRLRYSVCLCSSRCFNLQALHLSIADILHAQSALFPFMQFMKSEGALNILQFCLTVGMIKKCSMEESHPSCIKKA